jgi:hypothetical protein
LNAFAIVCIAELARGGSGGILPPDASLARDAAPEAQDVNFPAASLAARAASSAAAPAVPGSDSDEDDLDDDDVDDDDSAAAAVDPPCVA